MNAPQATEGRADYWRAGCECARAGLCYRCLAAAEIERLDLARLQAIHERDCAVEDVKRLDLKCSALAVLLYGKPSATEQHARRIKLHRALYEWKDYGGPIEDVLEAIGDYVIGVLDEQRARPAPDVRSMTQPEREAMERAFEASITPASSGRGNCVYADEVPPITPDVGTGTEKPR